jgi:hypothetical protein
MKRVILTILMLAMASSLLSAIVDSKRAEIVALNFLSTRIQDAIQPRQVREVKAVTYMERLTYYVINIEPQGWVLIAADDAHYPVLGYSEEGMFNSESMPPATAGWIEDLCQSVQEASQMDGPDSFAVQQAWLKYQYSTILSKSCDCAAVKPLISTKWSQGEPYNWSCPKDGDYAVTGCVATALGQIMKYWEHPVKAEGKISYHCPNFGTLSHTFGEEYAWDGMKDVMTEDDIFGQIFAVAHLLRDIGYAVEMEYGIDGSSASNLNAIRALINHFRYAADLIPYSRDKFEYSDWIKLLKDELDEKRPVYYSGVNQANTAGHAFIVDGYSTCDGATCFHLNWGWGGDDDGYYYLSDLTPGSHDYRFSQLVITGIKPVAGSDDTPATANYLRLPFYVTYNIESSYDVDWYVFYLKNGTNVEIHTESVDGSLLDPRLYLYGPYASTGSFVDTGDYCDSNNNSYDGRNARIQGSISESGYYFLRVAQSEILVWQREKSLAGAASAGSALHNETRSEATTGKYLLYIENYQPSYSVFENFEEDFLPARWDLISKNSTKTWKQGNLTNYDFSSIDEESKYSAICPWDDAAPQDEELYSHPFSLGHGTGYLRFYAYHNPYFLDNYSFTLFLRVKGEYQAIWRAGNEDGHKGWRRYQIDLSAYQGLSDLKLCWQYNGQDGDAVAIDQVGVYRDKVTGVEQLIETKPPMPTTIALSNVYPNPFNPVAHIEFSLPAAAHAYLAVYDINGRQVDVLRDKKFSPGIYRVDWDASTLPSGTYFIRLKSGQFTQTRNCVLLR